MAMWLACGRSVARGATPITPDIATPASRRGLFKGATGAFGSALLAASWGARVLAAPLLQDGPQQVAQDLGDGTAQNWLVYSDGRQVPVGCRYSLDTGECVAPGATEAVPAPARPGAITLPAWPDRWAREPQRPVTVVIEDQWGGAPTMQTVYATFNGEFLERHPNFTLDVRSHNGLDALLAEAAGGTLGDVVFQDDTWIQLWIKKGLATELTPLVQSDPGFEFDKIAKISLGPGMSQGKLYAIPYGWVCRGLGYNKQLFDRVGLKYPDETWTWDTVRQVSKQLTIPNQQWGYYIHGWGSWPMQGEYLVPFGGALVDEEETQVRITQPESVRALEWWGDFAMKDRTALGEWDVGPGKLLDIQGHPFPRGKVAMAPWGSWYTPNWKGQNPNILDQADVALFPMGPVRRSAAACDARYVITSQSKNVEAAWTYLREYMSARGMTQVFALTAWDWTSRPESQEYYLGGPNLAKSAKLWIDLSNNFAVPCRPLSAPGPQMMDVFKKYSAEYVAGKIGPSAFAQAVATEVEPLVAQNRG